MTICSYLSRNSRINEKAPELTKNTTKYFVAKGTDRFKKDFTLSEGLGIVLRNNEIKDIIKVTKSLKNRGILLKGTNRKTASQEGGFLNFPRLLMTAGLP